MILRNARRASRLSVLAAIGAALGASVVACGSSTDSTPAGAPSADAGGAIPGPDGSLPALDTDAGDAGARAEADASATSGCTSACTGMCTNGRCLTTLGGSGDGLDVLTISGARLFAATAGARVLAIPIDGSPVTTVYAGDGVMNDAIFNLVVDATDAYVVDGTTLSKLPLAGGAPTVLATGTSQGLALDAAGDVFYLGQDSTITELPAGGGGPTLIDMGPDEAQMIGDGKSVFWLDTSGDLHVYANGASTLLVHGLTDGRSSFSLASNGKMLAWSSFGTYTGGGKVGLVTADGTQTSIATDEADPDALAIDDTSVYWGSGGDGSIKKWSLGGKTTEVIATNQGDIRNLVVDATSLYYIEGGAVAVLTPK